MLRYPVLFIHVISAMGIFAALGIEAAALYQLRRATGPGDVRVALQAYGLVRLVGALSLVGTLLSGIYLATTAWQWRGAWIGLGFLGLIITAGIGGTATRVGVTRLQQGTAGDDRAVSVLRASLLARLAMLIGVVYLMTVKPGTRGSLVVMGIGVAAAAIVGLAILRGGGGGAARATPTRA
jgi:hypothetical protein